MNYYNEIDPFAAQWLHNLIAAGLIPPGDVDTRSIEDVTPADLAGYTQCHFFAGIGGWSLALRLAGWPDDRPVWTGSCPCQPFSAAGKGGGLDDERHLWPAFYWLIRQRRPDVVLGEQVASPAGLGWFDVVSTDLEAEGYAVGAVDLCAAGVGAPHIRQRQGWVAYGFGSRLEGQRGGSSAPLGRLAALRPAAEGCESGGVGNASHTARQRDAGTLSGTEAGKHGAGVAVNGNQPVRPEHAGPSVGGLADAAHLRRDQGRQCVAEASMYGATGDSRMASGESEPGPLDGFWRDADWLFCRDGKWRPVEPGTFPLAHGVPGRVGRLRAYGNAIVPKVFAEMIRVLLEAERCTES